MHDRGCERSSNAVLLGLPLALDVSAGRDAAAQAGKGSQLLAEENHCALCHAEEVRWHGEQRRLYVPHQHWPTMFIGTAV